MRYSRTFSVTHRRYAWLAPVATVAVIAAGVGVVNSVGATSASASEHPNLPPVSASALLASALSSQTAAFSGTVSESAHWGLPSLPGGDSAASLGWQQLLTGSHTLRVAANGPTKQRIAVLGSLSESDAIHNGADLWTYTSDTNSVTHATLAAATSTDPEPSAADLTPQAAAQRLLTGLEPSTVVSVDRTQVVAGRPAYTLVLTPRDTSSTLREIAVAVDAQHHLPLALSIFGAGATPAFQTEFTSVSFSAPAASTFDFRAPKGATVATDPFGARALGASAARPDDAAQPRVLGAGWTSILEVSAPSNPPANQSDRPLAGRRHVRIESALGVLSSLTSPVGTSADRLLSTAVFNVLLTPDGRIFAGAVTPAALENAAARNPR